MGSRDEPRRGNRRRLQLAAEARGATGVRFTPIPRDKQTHAVGFLNANAFEVPSWVGPGNRTAADAAVDFDVSVDPVSCWVDYAIRGKG